MFRTRSNGVSCCCGSYGRNGGEYSGAGNMSWLKFGLLCVTSICITLDTTNVVAQEMGRSENYIRL